MVVWETVCKPTELDGLGVSDLKLASFALQSRWLWLQKTDQDRAWSQLPIKVDPQVHGKIIGLMGSQFLRSPPRCRTLFLPELNGTKQSGKV